MKILKNWFWCILSSESESFLVKNNNILRKIYDPDGNIFVTNFAEHGGNDTEHIGYLISQGIELLIGTSDRYFKLTSSKNQL